MTSEFLGDDNFDTTLGSVGHGQTWQHMGGSRASNIEYTNNTGKPIQLLISRSARAGVSSKSILMYVDGLLISNSSSSGAVEIDYRVISSPIIPDGSTYEIGGTAGFVYWFELR